MTGASPSDLAELSRGKGSARDRVEAGSPDTKKRLAKGRKATAKAQKQMHAGGGRRRRRH